MIILNNMEILILYIGTVTDVIYYRRLAYYVTNCQQINLKYKIFLAIRT